MKKAFIYIVLIFIPRLLLSQIYSCEYKKTFYNKNLVPVDSIQSVYWGYDLYQGKSLVYHTSKKDRRNTRLISQSNDELKIGIPIRLNDTITRIAKNKDGQIYLVSTRVYKDGYPNYYSAKHYSQSEENPWFEEVIEFHKRYNDQNGSYYGYELKHQKMTKQYWFYFNGKKWKTKEIK